MYGKESVITSYSIHYTKLYDTCATYGPPERVPMTEDLPQNPINPYGESKLMFEKVLQWYHRITSYNVCYTKLLRFVVESAIVFSGVRQGSPVPEMHFAGGDLL